MLVIYNSMTGKKEPFKPIVTGKVGIYVCGMTVYDLCHIGHARTVTAFDVIVRYLRYQGYQVTYVRNITDVDDKIIARANENQEDCNSLTERMIGKMHEDFAQLGNIAPDVEPKATEYIHEMQTLIQTLIDKNYAYLASNGDVYFRVTHFSQYGKLSNKVIADLESGARVAITDEKESPLDFVLWKKTTATPCWSSPWGEGRPGWHIECSAMSLNCLGKSFDIHGGGIDLKFPHHENEIAQSETANDQCFAHTWMHTGAVRVNDVKMSKSLGNFSTIREVLTLHDAETVRYFLIASHYRSPINFSENNLNEAREGLARLYGFLDKLDHAQKMDYELEKVMDQKIIALKEAFIKAMNDDFNTPEALAVLFNLVRTGYAFLKEQQTQQVAQCAGLLIDFGAILGILQQDPRSFLEGVGFLALNQEQIMDLIEQRNQAKQTGDYKTADAIRQHLLEKGVDLQDSRDGTKWRFLGIKH